MRYKLDATAFYHRSHKLRGDWPEIIMYATINIQQQSGKFVTNEESTMIHHNHPKATVYVRIPYWWCTLYGLGQMYRDMYP